MMIIYDIQTHPPEMKKKITLFKHFKKYFLFKKNKEQREVELDKDEFLTQDEIMLP